MKLWRTRHCLDPAGKVGHTQPPVLRLLCDRRHAFSLQSPKVWIDKFKGKFDMGWDRYREIVFERQKQLGVVPPDTQLTPRPAELPAWNSLSPDQKKVSARLMEVFAGYLAQTDHEIGRVIDAIAATGQLNNTLISFHRWGQRGQHRGRSVRNLQSVER